jgi:hypothetical protein
MKLALLLFGAVVACVVGMLVGVPLMLVGPAGALGGGVAAGGSGSTGTPSGGPPPADVADVYGPAPATSTLDNIPPNMLVLYVGEADRCPGLPWSVLAGIGEVETGHGQGGEVSPAGALGPMQFMPATWAEYATDANGDGDASLWDPADAVAGAADYLCHNGGGSPATLSSAIFAYNHDDSYVRLVISWAARYERAAEASG